MNESYLTVMDPVEVELTEKHSRFLGYMCPVTSKEQAEEFIAKIKKEHKDASHNVPAYIIHDTGVMHCSDDGEPQGTAGKPVLEILKREQIFDICVVITRYFGGVLLGTGGLVRAYSNTCKKLIEGSALAKCTICDSLMISASYSDFGKVENIMEDFDIRIENKDFTDRVNVAISIQSDLSKFLNDALTEATGGKVQIKNNGKKSERIPI